MLERINFYDGGVVTLAKNLSDQGKTIKEILEEHEISMTMKKAKDLLIGKGCSNFRNTKGRGIKGLKIKR